MKKLLYKLVDTRNNVTKKALIRWGNNCVIIDPGKHIPNTILGKSFVLELAEKIRQHDSNNKRDMIWINLI